MDIPAIKSSLRNYSGQLSVHKDTLNYAIRDMSLTLDTSRASAKMSLKDYKLFQCIRSVFEFRNKDQAELAFVKLAKSITQKSMFTYLLGAPAMPLNTWKTLRRIEFFQRLYLIRYSEPKYLLQELTAAKEYHRSLTEDHYLSHVYYELIETASTDDFWSKVLSVVGKNKFPNLLNKKDVIKARTAFCAEIARIHGFPESLIHENVSSIQQNAFVALALL